MGSCISHYTDQEALGEADIRARAIAVGWRVDALGRLACPQCQQADSWFWTAHPVALWDRDTAVAMTTLLAAAVREITGADGAAGVDPPDAIPGGKPARSQAPGRRWPVRRAGDATGGTRPTLTVPSEESDAQGNDDTDGEPGR